MKKFLLIAVVAVFYSVGLGAQNLPPLSVLTVDMAKVYNGYEKAERSREQFQKAVEKAQDEMRTMLDEGVKMAKELQEVREKMDNPALSDNARNKFRKQAEDLEEKVHKKEVEVNQFRQETDRELSQRREEFVSRHIDEIKKVIKAIAEKRGANIVLNSTGMELLYYEDQFDITGHVLKVLNKSK
ncbi:MAG: OmpH family outer membrane protein [Puniceicoccales bacterium]|jgi:Skp family chaperone for outer membrane proteins|nr:OmpH family outer membrane protein [Puniceicoccales bacterium]